VKVHLRLLDVMVGQHGVGPVARGKVKGVVGIHRKVFKIPLHTHQLLAIILLVAFINKNNVFYF
jgi:hypothetical protein